MRRTWTKAVDLRARKNLKYDFSYRPESQNSVHSGSDDIATATSKNPFSKKKCWQWQNSLVSIRKTYLIRVLPPNTKYHRSPKRLRTLRLKTSVAILFLVILTSWQQRTSLNRHLHWGYMKEIYHFKRRWHKVKIRKESEGPKNLSAQKYQWRSLLKK